MPIETVIERLQELQAKGAKRVFIEDMTNAAIFDLVSIEVDSDGDVMMSGD